MTEDVLDALQDLVQSWEDGGWEWSSQRFKHSQAKMEELIMLLESNGRVIRRQVGVEL
jgi:hypothetical protein